MDRKQPGETACTPAARYLGLRGKPNSINRNVCTGREVIEKVSLIVINVDFRGLLTLHVMSNTDT